MVRNWKSIWDAIRYFPVAYLLHLNGRMRRADRNKEGTCVSRGQAKSDQGRKASMKVYLHPDLEKGGMPLVGKTTAMDATFPLSFRKELMVPEPHL